MDWAVVPKPPLGDEKANAEDGDGVTSHIQEATQGGLLEVHISVRRAHTSHTPCLVFRGMCIALMIRTRGPHIHAVKETGNIILVQRALHQCSQNRQFSVPWKCEYRV